MTPIISRTFSACRSEPLFTPNCFASSRSGGNFPPGATTPREINDLILSINCAVRVVSSGFLLATRRPGFFITTVLIIGAHDDIFIAKFETKGRALVRVMRSYQERSNRWSELDIFYGPNLEKIGSAQEVTERLAERPDGGPALASCPTVQPSESSSSTMALTSADLPGRSFSRIGTSFRAMRSVIHE